MNNLRYSSFQRCLSFLVSLLIVLTSVYPLTVIAFSGGDGEVVKPDVLSYENQRILQYDARLVYGATNIGTDNEPNYIKTLGLKDTVVKYEVDYEVSGEDEFAPGEFTITVPKHIFKDRKGKYADSFNMMLMSAEEVSEEDETHDYVYRERENDILIYNRLPIDQVQQGIIQISYTLIKDSFDYIDASCSEDFVSDLTIYSGDADVMHKRAIAPTVTVDSTAQITYLTKRIADKSSPMTATWNRKWGKAEDFDISNPELYNYVIWQVGVSTFATQPYVLAATESPSGTYDNVSVVGYRHASETKYSPTLSQDKVFTTNGTNYIYVLVKFLKSAYDGKEQYTIDGDTTVTVIPNDLVDATSSKTINGQAENNTTKSKEYTSNSSPSWHTGNSSFGQTSNQESSEEETWHDYTEIPGGFQFVEEKPVYPSNSQSLLITDGKGNSNKLPNYYGSIVNYQLDELRTGNRTFLYEGITYTDNYKGYGYRETLSSPNLFQTWSAYGKTPVTYALESDTLNLFGVESDDVELSGNDYRISEFELGYAFTSASKPGNQFVACAPSYRKADTVDFYIKVDSKTNPYIQIGSISLRSTIEDFDENYVESYERQNSSSYLYKIVLKDNVNCIGYKVSAENLMFSAQFIVQSQIQLLSSETVMNKANEVMTVGQRYIDLEHRAMGSITNGNETRVCYSESGAIDRVMAIINSSNLEKIDTLKILDKTNQVLRMGWKVRFHEGGQAQYGYEYIAQDSGVFYDLLPEGSYFDESTLQVLADDVKLSSTAYTVEYVDNFRNTDKQLIVVRILEPCSKTYTLLYQTIYSFENMYDRGVTLLNSVAYETGNNFLFSGKLDDGGDIIERVNMAKLDPDCKTKRFVYAERTRFVNDPIAVSLGLSKKIKKDTSILYGKSIVAYQNDYYDYQLRYVASMTTKAKNLVLYDNIENYNSDKYTSEWHGCIDSVNLAYATQKGVNTIVYLSDQDLDMSVEGNRDLTNTELWTLYDDFEDKTQARSIAFDMRKAADGSDFILHSGQSMLVSYRMRAPSSDPRDEEDIKEPLLTYNQVYLGYDMITIATPENPLITTSSKVMNFKKTTAEFRIVADVRLHKVDIRDTSTAIGGISFALEGTSDYGDNIKIILDTDKQGNLIFRNVPKGTYSLYEYSGNDDYLMDINTYIVVINKDGKVFINDEEQTDPYLLEDVPRIHTDVQFAKKDLVHKQRTIEGARFRLSGVSDYTTYTMKFADSDANGLVTFPNVEKGTYTLIEVAAPSEYVTGTTVYTVIVTEEANVIISSDSEIYEAHQNVDSSYELYNAPYHSFTIQKYGTMVIGGNSLTVAGAKFRLYGMADDGTYYDRDRTTGTNGQALFSMIKAGTYVLQEIEAPDGYILDDSKRVVTVDDYGTVTIAGVEQDDYGRFVLRNKENGSVVITKKWIDLPTSVRPDITINVSLTMPKSDVYFSRTCLNSYNRNNINYFQKANLAATDEAVIRKATVSKPNSRSIKLTNGNTYTFYRADDRTTNNRIYIYSDGGTVYWWSNATDVHLPIDASSMFANATYLYRVDFTGIDTLTATNMAYMFQNDYYLNKLIGLDTSNVTTMESMFYNCQALNDVFSCNFNTENVLNMDYMFYHAKFSTGFQSMNTANTTSMRYMFAYAKDVDSSAFTNFHTDNVRYMQGMFNHAVGALNGSGKRVFELDGWDVSNVIDISDMFSYTYFDKIALKNMAFSSIDSLARLFYQSYVSEVEFDNFNTSTAKNMSYMFYDCVKLTDVNVEELDVSNVEDMSYMFYGTSVTQLDISTWDTGKLINLNYAFAYNDLESMPTDFVTRDFTSLETANYAFRSTHIRDVVLTGWDAPVLQSVMGMFFRCVYLETVDMSDALLPELTDATYMFSECSHIKWSYSTSYSGYYDFSPTNSSNSGRIWSYKYYYTSDPTYCRRVQYNYGTQLSYDSYYYYQGAYFDYTVSENSNTHILSGSASATWTFNGENMSAPNINAKGMFMYSAVLTANFRNADFENITSAESMFEECRKVKTIEMRGIISDGDSENGYSMHNMFSECTSLTNLYSLDLDTTYVTDMSYMFKNCSSLASTILSNFDTSHVTNMSGMFYGCSTINSLSVANFVTDNVRTMDYMFAGCSTLPTLDVSNFNTSAVTTMAYMFYNCSNLGILNLGDMNTVSVVYMQYMFAGCKRLPSLDLGSRFYTGHVYNMSYMFNHCESLPDLDVGGYFDTSSVYYMDYMFSYCKALTDLNLREKFNTTNVSSAQHMFEHCESLPTLDLGNYFVLPYDLCYFFSDCYELVEVENLNRYISNKSHIMSYMFANCSSYSEIELTDVRFGSVDNMFADCTSITSVTITGNASNSGSADRMFYNCSNLETINLALTGQNCITSAASMFEGCEVLSNLLLPSFDCATIKSTSKMFKDCKSIDYLDLDWTYATGDDSALTDMQYMFQNCSAELYMSINTSKVTTMLGMFYGYSYDGDLDLSCFDTSSVTNMGQMFRNCKATSIDLSSFNTSSVTSMNYMFSGSDVEELDLSNFNTAKVSSFAYMFNNCANLTSVDVRSFVTTGVNNMSYMFCKCVLLTELDLTSFDTQKLSNARCMFDGCTALVTIKASDKFVKTKITTDANMFRNCTSIVGGFGTVYDSSVTGKDGIDVYFTIIVSTSSGASTHTHTGVIRSTTSSVVNTNASPDTVQTVKTTTKVYTGVIKTTSSSAPVVNPDSGDTGDGDDDEEEPTVDPTLIFTNSSPNCTVEQIDANTYQYTFSGMSKNVEYYVWEDELVEYVCDANILHVMQTNQGAATITNTQDPLPVGDLEVTVEVQPHSGVLTDAERAEKFDYSFVIKDSTGAVKSGMDIVDCKFTDAAGVESDIALIFVDGVAHVQLSHNEKILIPKRFDKYKYETSQEEHANYTLTNPSNKNGEIAANETKHVKYINKKQYVTENDLTTFNLKKVITGEYVDEDAEFDFVVDLSNLRANENYKYISDVNGETTFKSNDIGKAYVQLTLKHNETVTFKVAKDSFYRITEEESDYVASYQITDTSNMGLIAEDSGSNTVEKQALSTSTETADVGEAVTVTFYNKKNYVRDLYIAKQLTGTNHSNDIFTVSVYMEGLESGARLDSTLGILTADSDGILDLAFSISGNEVVKIEGVPVGATYRITETRCSYLASYELHKDTMTGELISSGENADTNMDMPIGTRTMELSYNPYIVFTNEKIKCDVSLRKEIDMTYGIVPEYIYKNIDFEFEVELRGIGSSRLSDYVVDFMVDDVAGSTACTLADMLGLSGDAANIVSSRANFTVSLHCGETVIFRDLPYQAFVSITEVGHPDYIASYTATVNEGGTLQSVSAANTAVDVDLSLTTDEYIDLHDRLISFVFTNHYQFNPYFLPNSGFEDNRTVIVLLMTGMLIASLGYWYISKKKREPSL